MAVMPLSSVRSRLQPALRPRLEHLVGGCGAPGSLTSGWSRATSPPKRPIAGTLVAGPIGIRARSVNAPNVLVSDGPGRRRRVNALARSTSGTRNLRPNRNPTGPIGVGGEQMTVPEAAQRTMDTTLRLEPELVMTPAELLTAPTRGGRCLSGHRHVRRMSARRRDHHRRRRACPGGHGPGRVGARSRIPLRQRLSGSGALARRRNGVVSVTWVRVTARRGNRTLRPEHAYASRFIDGRLASRFDRCGADET